MTNYEYQKLRKRFSALDWFNFNNGLKHQVDKIKWSAINDIQCYDNYKKETDTWSKNQLNKQKNPPRLSFSDILVNLEFQEKCLNTSENKKFSEYFRIRKDFSKEFWILFRRTSLHLMESQKTYYRNLLKIEITSYNSSLSSAKRIGKDFIDITDMWANEKHDNGIFTPETVYYLNNFCLKTKPSLTGDQISNIILEYLSLDSLITLIKRTPEFNPSLMNISA
jgi:hypothetical protein